MSAVYLYGIWFLKGLREYTSSGFQAASYAFESLDGMSVRGRSYMITGANSGIGKETALAVAKKGGTVYMVCRNKERGEAAQKEIQKASGNTDVHLYLLDMSNPKKVYEFANEFKKSRRPLNVLVNNAGCMTNQMTLNEYNLEVNFATNTLGTYILTESLIELLQTQVNPQVITVTSGSMLLTKLDFSDLQSENMLPFDGSIVHAQSKRQQVVLTDYWARTYRNVHFSCMHPGWVDTPIVRSSMADFHGKLQPRLRTPIEGADTLIWLCVSPSSRKEKSGGYFQDRRAVSKHLPITWTQNTEDEEKKLVEKLNEIVNNFHCNIFNKC